MATDTSEIRSTLNDLIQTAKDGEEGFRTSAEKLQNTEFRRIFENFASQRSRYASELQSQVSRVGGTAETSGHASAALHRGWIDLKSALTGNDDHAILAEAERGEDVAVKAYRDAIAKDLPSDIRSLIESQYQEVQDTHNQVKAMRDGRATSTSGSSVRY